MLSAEESHTLLSFINAVAPTRDTDELLRTIIAELQPVFSFHDAELFVVNKEENYYHRLTIQTPQSSPQDISRTFGKQPPQQPYRSSWVAKAIQRVETSGGPVRLTHPEPVDHSAPGQSTKDQERLVTILRVQDDIFGLICFSSLWRDHFHPEQFALFQAVANPIAITLGHVLAREEMLVQNQRVEQLVTISHHHPDQRPKATAQNHLPAYPADLSLRCLRPVCAYRRRAISL